MSEIASAKFVRQLQAKVADQEARIRRLEAKQYPRRKALGGGGGSSIVAVCTACAYDDVTHSLVITAVRLDSIPYTFDPDNQETFVAWAGVDPLLITDMICVLIPIAAIPGDTSYKYMALPVIAADRAQLTPPAMECLTEFTDPCSGDVAVDLCS